MEPLGDFIRDVAFYVGHGALVRDYLAGEIRKYADRAPVVVLAHSLGGIAAVDLLADPVVMHGGAPLKVDLLVTVGSQAPFMYLMDAMHSLGPRDSAHREPAFPALAEHLQPAGLAVLLR